MRTLYLFMPELPRTRHIIVEDRHIVNTAAPESNVFTRVQPRARIGRTTQKVNKSPRTEAGES